MRTDEKMEKILEGKYGNFAGLLGDFEEDTWHSDRDDEYTIASFITTRTPVQIKRTIQQAMKVLLLKKFPADWIRSLSCRRPPKFIRPLDSNPTPEDYHAWVEWMVEALQEEAKRQGKL